MFNKLIGIVIAIIAYIIYTKLDQAYNITNKISSKIPVQEKWKAAFFYCSILISILVIGILTIYIIDIPNIINYMLNGALVGTGLAITNRMAIKSK